MRARHAAAATRWSAAAIVLVIVAGSLVNVARAQPANDLCANAIPLQCGSQVLGTTVNATFDNVGTCGTSNTAPGVWYTVVGTGGVMTLTTCHSGTSSFDSKISVFRGSCAGLVCVGGNDDMGSACALSVLHSEVSWLSELGTTYFILVHGFATSTGAFELSVTCTTMQLAQPGTCYASSGREDGGRLYTIDVATGAATLIGSTGLGGVPGLAIDSQGRIFGTMAQDPRLFRIDAVTGAAVLVGDMGVAFVDGIAFDENDVLYGIGDDLNLRTIDTNNGASTIVGLTDEVIAGLSFDPSDGQLYGSVGGLATTPDAIFRIDTSNGARTLVGTTGVAGGGSIPDIAFFGGQLYGLKLFAGVGRLITIDKATGGGVLVGSTGVGPMSGLDCFEPPLQAQPVLIALNDLLQSGDVDQLLEIPDVNTGVAQLIGSLGDAFINSEAMAVLHGGNNNCKAGVNTSVCASALTERIFVVDDDRLLEVDPTTGEGTLIGPIGFSDVDGIAFDAAGVLWGVTYGSNKLITIDINTGDGTLAVDDVLQGHRMNDIAFIGTRCFVLTDEVPSRIYELDVTNGDKLHKWILDGEPESLESLLPLLNQENGQVVTSAVSSFQFYSAGDRDDSKDLVLITIPDDDSEVGTAAFVSSESSGFLDIEALAWLTPQLAQVLLTKEEGVPVDAPRATSRLALHQNVPNPFNPSTRIAFELPQSGVVQINIYDVAGRFVVSLHHGHMDAGAHTVTWNGKSWRGQSVAAGIYRYQLKTSMGTQSRSMVLLK